MTKWDVFSYLEARTGNPHTIYGYLGAHAIEMLKATHASPEEMAQAEQFWSARNRRRQAQY